MSILNPQLIQDFKDYPLYSQENEKNPLVVAKLFDNSGTGTWYLTELDPKEKTAFGYVTGLIEDEWGYIHIPELEAIKHPVLKIPRIERDLSFQPTPIGEILPHLVRKR